ncbi:hydrogen peroxide stress regulator 1 [Sphaceloma murrayae]|uniref:Hydrogen peroxide stress regulator 1 n=1 Tax=Sphaceloma murrayae TaxID=2082308 RepID=A0A2K1R2J4_9PEZI|nr:hydrogen peroxide stress regulator 1 [Sphaceloma murrayae]
MDGRNSSGRKVSLLNDSSSSSVGHVAAARSELVPVKLPSLSAGFRTHSHSHSSRSASSTPSLSPQTPPLTRSESSDSRAFGSPSPLTPSSTSFENPAGFTQKQQSQGPNQSYYLYRQPWSKMDDPLLFPTIPEGAPMTGLPLPPLMNGNSAPRVRSSDSPTSDSRVSNASAASAPKQTTKKSQYPCPLAKQFNCSDYFTTSGHAARHAKKHTGRKDAICPECNKAFTRKDNMEQHRRTHQNVRGPAKNENRVKKPSTKSSSRKGDKNTVSTTASLEAAVAQLDEAQAQVQLHNAPDFTLANQTIQPAMLPANGPYYMSADPIAALPQPMTTDFTGRPSLYRSNYTNSLDFTTATIPNMADPNELQFNYPSPGLSNGLNTLALAASGHRRLSSEHRQPSEDGSSKSSTSESRTP